MEQKITPSIATKIKSMYQSGIFELTFEDVEKMRLIPGDDIIIKPNLFLERQFLFKLYKIKILNDQKDIEGRWLDEYVDFERIIKVLIEFKISMKTLSEVNEISLNKSLEKHFKNYFVNAHMSSGKQRSYFDLVIGNMNFVIEIKLAKALKNTGQMQKAIGQIDRYKSELKNNNIILLVIGEKMDRQDKNILLIKNDIENNKQCKFYFLEAT